MDHTTLYVTVFYFLTYRLAILLLGAGAIYLGYRLFIKGFDHGRAHLQELPDPEKKQAPSTTADGAELTAKAGQLNLTLKNAAPGTFFAAFGAIITTAILMGNPPQFDYSKNSQEKKDAVETTTVTVRGRDAGAIHDQIWKQDFASMLQKAKDVVALAPDDPNFQDTLASLYFLHNDYTDAVATQTLAVEKARKANIAEDGVQALEEKLHFYQQFTSK